jgi:hypothetical protein
MGSAIALISGNTLIGLSIPLWRLVVFADVMKDRSCRQQLVEYLRHRFPPILQETNKISNQSTNIATW